MQDAARACPLNNHYPYLLYTDTLAWILNAVCSSFTLFSVSALVVLLSNKPLNESLS